MQYFTKMNAFLMLIGLHWVEHLFQAYQVYFLHLHRECALGFLGMKFPWLVRTESLHFGFAILTFLGMYYLAPLFVHGNSWTPWFVGWLWSMWHVLEHLLLFMQVVVHHNFFFFFFFFGRPVPTSVLQFIFPRVELHLFYNSIITFYIVKALIYEHRDALAYSKTNI